MVWVKNYTKKVSKRIKRGNYFLIHDRFCDRVLNNYFIKKLFYILKIFFL